MCVEKIIEDARRQRGQQALLERDHKTGAWLPIERGELAKNITLDELSKGNLFARIRKGFRTDPATANEVHLIRGPILGEDFVCRLVAGPGALFSERCQLVFL